MGAPVSPRCSGLCLHTPTDASHMIPHTSRQDHRGGSKYLTSLPFTSPLCSVPQPPLPFPLLPALNALCSHLMRFAVRQGLPNSDDEDSCVLLQQRLLALLASELGPALEHLRYVYRTCRCIGRAGEPRLFIGCAGEASFIYRTRS